MTQMYVYKLVYTCTYIYIHTYIYIYICIYIDIETRIYICMLIHVCIYIFIYTFMCMCAYIRFYFYRWSCRSSRKAWRRPIGCLIFLGHCVDHFPQKRPIISGSFAKNEGILWVVEGILWVFATLHIHIYIHDFK